MPLRNKITDSNNLDKRLKLILEVIFETGNGKTKETAIKIAKIEDDIIIMNIIGFKGGKESFETLEDKVYSVWDNGKEKIYFEDCSGYKYK